MEPRPASPYESSDQDPAAASVPQLTGDCISKFERCVTRNDEDGTPIPVENRLADLRLWADGVGALAEGNASLEWRFRTRPDDLLLVKTLLIVLGDFIDDYAGLPVPTPSQQEVQDALRRIDSEIENLSLIGLAIRRTGKASRRRKADARFNPQDYKDLRTHLECIVLLRPSKSGLPERIDASALNPMQKRLITANLMRRHRFAIAQKRSRKSGMIVATATPAALSSINEGTPSRYEGQSESGTVTPAIANPKKEDKTGAAPSTLPGLTAASTAEGTVQYWKNRQDVPEVARTQITALATDVEFPQPPRLGRERNIAKCPCCCQSLPLNEMADPDKWRQHIIEDLQPYTCIIEECPTPNALYNTKKGWEAHVRADHEIRRQCPLCEDEPVVFLDKSDTIGHLEQEHRDTLANLSLETLLSWSERQSLGISVCPLCASFGAEDSPEIVEHVLQHAFDFSLRALPWTRPSHHETKGLIGTHRLPGDSYEAEKLIEWIDTAEAGSSSELQLTQADAETQISEADEDDAEDAGYVPQDEYFDDESVDNSSRPDATLNGPSYGQSSARSLHSVISLSSAGSSTESRGRQRRRARRKLGNRDSISRLSTGTSYTKSQSSLSLSPPEIRRRLDLSEPSGLNNPGTTHSYEDNMFEPDSWPSIELPVPEITTLSNSGLHRILPIRRPSNSWNEREEKLSITEEMERGIRGSAEPQPRQTGPHSDTEQQHDSETSPFPQGPPWYRQRLSIKGEEEQDISGSAEPQPKQTGTRSNREQLSRILRKLGIKEEKKKSM